MNIGLMAVDSVYPNLALMKISSWHKAKGDCVEWYNPFDEYDVVFTSCLVNIESAKEIPEALMYAIFVVAELYGIDLIWHIKEKMIYNEMREMLHGKSY